MILKEKEKAILLLEINENNFSSKRFYPILITVLFCGFDFFLSF
jgi:hypothetical protein